MKPITQHQVFTVELDTYGVDASELGLAPGNFPKELSTIMGNGLPFQIIRTVYNNEELLKVVYMQLAGCVYLNVYND